MKRLPSVLLLAAFLFGGCSDSTVVAPDLDAGILLSTVYEANPGSMGQIFEPLFVAGIGVDYGDFVCIILEDFIRDPNPDWVRSSLDRTPSMEHFVAAPGYMVVLNFGNPDYPFLLSGQAHGGFNVHFDKQGEFQRGNFHANGQLTDGEGYTYSVNCKDAVNADGQGTGFFKINRTSKKPVAVSPI